MLPDAKKLREEHYRSFLQKKKIWDVILKMCSQKILSANKNQKTFTIFIVPEIINGHLDYDVIECIKYLIQQLQKNNYVAEYLEKNMIYIDWGSINNFQNQTNSINQDNPLSNKIKQETIRLLKKYPNIGQIEYEIKK